MNFLLKHCCCCCPWQAMVHALNSTGLTLDMLREEAGSEQLQEPSTVMEEEEEEEEQYDPMAKLLDLLRAGPVELGYETCLSNPRLTIYHRLMPPAYQHSSFIFRLSLGTSFEQARNYFRDDPDSCNPLLESLQHKDDLLLMRFKRVASLPPISVEVARRVQEDEQRFCVAYYSPSSFSAHSQVQLAGAAVEREEQGVRVQCVVEARLNCSMSWSALKQPCVKHIQNYVDRLTDRLLPEAL